MNCHFGNPLFSRKAPTIFVGRREGLPLIPVPRAHLSQRTISISYRLPPFTHLYYGFDDTQANAFREKPLEIGKTEQEHSGLANLTR